MPCLFQQHSVVLTVTLFPADETVSCLELPITRNLSCVQELFVTNNKVGALSPCVVHLSFASDAHVHVYS